MELPNLASSLLRQCPFPLCHLKTKAAWATGWNQTLWSAYLSHRTAISATKQDPHVSTTRRQVAVRHVQACTCDWLTDRNTREILPFTWCFSFSRVLCRYNAPNLQSATAMMSVWLSTSFSDTRGFVHFYFQVEIDFKLRSFFSLSHRMCVTSEKNVFIFRKKRKRRKKTFDLTHLWPGIL